MYFVGMSLALAERSARRLHGRVYVEIRIPSSTPAGTVLSQTPNMWPVGLVVSTGPMKDGWTVLPGAVDTPLRRECAISITLTEDGNAHPLVCTGEHVNVGAWLFYARLHPWLMHLPRDATARVSLSSFCNSRPNRPPGYNLGGATHPQLVAEFELAYAYNGWTFHSPSFGQLDLALGITRSAKQCLSDLLKDSARR